MSVDYTGEANSIWFMGLWENFKTGQGLYAKARGNRFKRFGWILAYLYFLVLGGTIFGFAKEISTLKTDLLLASLSVAYVFLALLFVAGYYARKSLAMLPLLVFQLVIFIWTFVQMQRNPELTLQGGYKVFSPFFTGWLFGLVAYDYIRRNYKSSNL